ncbi:MAG: thioredoxin-like domain-containing protein [Gemmata sp.]
MTTSRVTVKTLGALALVVGFGSVARADPAPVTVEWAQQQKPKQPGVTVPPLPAGCKVAPIPDGKNPGKSIGSIVSGPDGKPVRQFVSYDEKNFNIIVYFVDGAEAYREVYPPDAKDAFQFRWVGPLGTKWGLDRNRDGLIDEWVVISPEEVSQEIAQAVVANDPKRLAALMVTKENLSALGLPPADADKVMARAAGAAKRLTDTAAALKLTDKAKWLHVEYGIPSTRPADSFGGREDYTAYRNGTVLVEDGGKGHALQTGELVQVGRAWKIVDGPSAGAAPPPNQGGIDAAGGAEVPEAIRVLVDDLNKLDKSPPANPSVAAVGEFNAKRADVLEQINARLTEDKKETWIKMLLDSHMSAGEAGEPGNKHLVRLKQFKDAYSQPGANQAIAAYAAYRLLYAENAVAMSKAKSEDFGAVQDKWRASLEEYVKAFPQSADAPEAFWRLGMAYEHSGAKDSEAKARGAFEALTKSFATTPQGVKAAGALKRLDSEGKPLELTGPVLGTAQPFNAAQPGKAVVVYYWASWSSSLAEDAKKLQALVKDYGPKGLVVVSVSLDHDAKAAADAVKASGLPGTHLFAPGGLESSPLAAAYGILAPPHVLVAGKDGKVANRNAGVVTLEDDLKKLLADK